MTSISNFGETGPYRDWKAAEINLYATGGLMNITGEPEEPPLKEGAPLAQLGAGQNAFVATMTALFYAEDTGEGQHVDLAIAEYATNVLENALMQYSYSGVEFTRVGNRGYGRAAWGIYPCQDGFVGIIAGPDQNWPEVANIMESEETGRPPLRLPPGPFAQRRRGRRIDAALAAGTRQGGHLKAGQDHGLGFSFVAGMQDILEMEQLVARDYFVELSHPVAGNFRYPGPPISPDASVVEPWVYPPGARCWPSTIWRCWVS